MLIAEVTGNVVSSHKNEELNGNKLLIINRISPDGKRTGKEFVAVDTVGAGIGEKVIVVQEGAVVQEILGNNKIPVHTIIVGIIDKIDFMEEIK
ncbi:MAG: EutN/CcmL family microcompartment protein [Candidatus Muiribacteriota bacterium]|jgi:ethanolamine utilization protein EutN